MTSRPFAIALAVFALGLGAAFAAMNRYDDAYRWVAHTSDVRLVIGRAVGHAASDASCDALTHDIHELARLTVDNPVQQSRLGGLSASVARRCAGGVTEQVIVQLSELDATERELMEIRRRELATTRTLAIFAFIGSMLSAILTVTIARWLGERARQALADNEERFRMLAAHASDLIRIHDASGQTIYASPSCERLLGYTPHEMQNMPPVVRLAHPDDLPAMRAALAQIQQQHATPSILRYRLRTKAGAYRWFETHTDPVRDRDGHLVRFYTTARDITERVEAQQQLETLSVTDELTGLLNRRGFMMLGEQQHRLAARQQRGVAVVFADLDGLKVINDTLGHELGDRAICQLAGVLRATFRETDLVARLGGDEFAVLAYDVDATGLDTMMERVRAAVEAQRDVTRAYPLSVSLGVALQPAGTRRTMEDLIADADARMYERKRERKVA